MRTDFDAALYGGPLDGVTQSFEKTEEGEVPDIVHIVVMAAPESVVDWLRGVRGPEGPEHAGAYHAGGISDNGRRAYFWISEGV